MSLPGANHLEIYLDDHWAGAAAGRSLAKRLYQNNRDTEWAGRLQQLVGQIEEDDQTLHEIRDLFGIEGGSVKRYLALAGERVSRLKLNGRLLGYSPLSRLIECEALEAGVSAKRRLWATLEAGYGDRPELQPFDLQTLKARADGRIEVLTEFHSYAAGRAFG